MLVITHHSCQNDILSLNYVYKWGINVIIYI